jgi:hypothetical protein
MSAPSPPGSPIAADALTQRDFDALSEFRYRLQAVHHSVVTLVARCEKAGLVTRRQNETERHGIKKRRQRRRFRFCYVHAI